MNGFPKNRRYLVGFSHKTHFFARGIMWFTQSEFSHTYMVQEGPQGRYVLEANFRGVNIQWYPVFVKEGALGREEHVIEHDLEAMDHAWDVICSRRLNRPYSYLQILTDAFGIAVQTVFKRSIPNPFNQKKADVCSELVLVWLRRAKMSGFEGLLPATVTPEDLVPVVRRSSQFSKKKK